LLNFKVKTRAMALSLFGNFQVKGIHVATVKVVGFVNYGFVNAKAVGEQFWTFHSRPRDLKRLR